VIYVSSWSYALTNKGRQLQAKAQAGVQLVYTRMGVGSGTLSGQSLESMNALITPVKDLTISRLKRPAGATRALIGATLTNQDITTGFYLREVGIFATDPDDGEVLYMYANAGATADYITPQGDGVIEKALNMNVFVGAAVNITANIDESLVYVTQQELADAISGIHIEDASTTKKGIVQLSNATNSTAEDRAATPKAVKSAYDAATAAQNTANAANGAAADAGTKADTAIAQLADLSSQAAGKGANLVGVYDAAGHFAGMNVEAVLAELFTFANNGKTGISSVIGSPATAGDSFATLAGLIQTNKDTLATNLGGKGVPAAGTETLAALVTKVTNVNMGKPFLSGSSGSGTGTSFTISGLSFAPKIVIYQHSISPLMRGIAVNLGVVTGMPQIIFMTDHTGSLISASTNWGSNSFGVGWSSTSVGSGQWNWVAIGY
jgi:phage-related tail fiber protein